MSANQFGYQSRSNSPARERMEAAGILAEARRVETAHAAAMEAAATAAKRHGADIEALKRGVEALAIDLDRLRHELRAERPAAAGEQPGGGAARPSIKAIQRLVCRHYDISELDLLSDRRQRVLIEPRHIAMYLAKHMTPASLPEIGRHFGGRDHTTIIHAVNRVERLLKQQPGFADTVARLRALLDDDPSRSLNAWQGPTWNGAAAPPAAGGEGPPRR